MALPLSTQDLLRAYEALGVSTHELDSIERAPYPQNEELLNQLKMRVSKRYKKLAAMLHPDTTKGDPEAAALFVLITRVAKDLAKRPARPELPLMAAPQVPVKSTGVVRVQAATKTVMKVNIRRPMGNSDQRSAREIAARLSKMRA